MQRGLYPETDFYIFGDSPLQLIQTDSTSDKRQLTEIPLELFAWRRFTQVRAAVWSEGTSAASSQWSRRRFRCAGVRRAPSDSGFGSAVPEMNQN